MILKSKKIVLRAVLPSDADLIYKWENDKSNRQFSGTKKRFTKKEIKNFIVNQKDIYLDKQLRLMICINSPLKKRDMGVVSIGCIDLFAFDEANLKAGIGILIDKKHRKKGYASDALLLLIKYSFEILNLRELFCNISEDNKPSIKLFQKQEFKFIGKKKNICSLQLTNK